MVLGRKGDVGRAALVEASQDGWVCGSDSIAVRLEPVALSSEFLADTLRIDYYRQQLHAQSTGAMVANVNESSLLSFRVPAISPAAQGEAVARLRNIHRRHDELVNRLERQLSLLREHRQALITAAVTGEFAVPGTAA